MRYLILLISSLLITLCARECYDASIVATHLERPVWATIFQFGAAVSFFVLGMLTVVLLSDPSKKVR